MQSLLMNSLNVLNGAYQVDSKSKVSRVIRERGEAVAATRTVISRKRDINDRSCGWAILSLFCRTRTINEGKAESVRVRTDEQSDMYRSYSYTSNGRGGRRGRAHFNIVPILRTVSLTHNFPRISASSS